MEPNAYQKKALGSLSEYLRLLDAHRPAEAYRELWEGRDVRVGLAGEGMPPYRDAIAGVPHVCLKVPTGGGKTFLAACALRRIIDATVSGGEGAVVWLTPSDAILEQTLASLTDSAHPYRQQLLKDFPAGVEVYSKEQLLSGQNFQNVQSVQEHLSVFVLSYDSFRTSNKDGRRAYRENERLGGFPISEALPDGADETSLANAISVLNPVVVVDESHHAAGRLSIEMLRNFNPRFILDLTATPRENSNIIAFAEAGELKRANMVKLPLIVTHRNDRRDVMSDAILLRARLEQQAVEGQAAGGRYIRPIVLFQAQPRGREDASTFQRLREQLVEGGIPAEHIAIKTADVNELRGVDLLSADCPVRFIITVNALKEGWDCPFAYILATLANKTSKVDVEQVVGRVLRQPYAEQHGSSLLNMAYVLTSSGDFAATLDGIVRALNTAGFGRGDARVAEGGLGSEAAVHGPEVEAEAAGLEGAEAAGPDADMADDYAATVSTALRQSSQSSISYLLVKAQDEAEEYRRGMDATDRLGLLGGVEGAMKSQYKVRHAYLSETEGLEVPQFCIATEASLFHDEGYIPLEKESLHVGFSLRDADSNVDLSLAAGAMYAVDAAGDGASYRKLTANESGYLRSQMQRLPDGQRLRFCVDRITEQLEKKPLGNYLYHDDIRAYVERVVGSLSGDGLASIETGLMFYVGRIQAKIEGLLSGHREKEFFDQVDTRDIQCRPLYRLPAVITPTETIDGLEKSLYESEARLNSTERKVIEEVAALDNVRWWHRISENRPYSFSINGFIRHYPDFLVMTGKGTLIVIEVKGDDRDNSDSERKLRLGRKWADMAGDGYRYYMVFDELDWDREGAYQLPTFVNHMRRL